MRRTATVSLKFTTEAKKDQLATLTEEYQTIVQEYIDIAWQDSSTKLNKQSLALIQDSTLSERYKSNALRQALQTIINTKKSAKRLGKPVSKPIFNGTMILDAKFVKIHLDKANHFDGWIRLSTLSRGHRIWIPFKRTKPLNKRLDKDFTLLNTIRLRQYHGNWYANLVLEKETIVFKTEGQVIGIDAGTKKALSLSTGQHIGDNYRYYIDKIRRKQRKSKNYQQALIERDNYLRQELNKIDFSSIKTIYVEDLKNIQRNTKKERRLNKTTRKILSVWVQAKTFGWLNHKCEENCVLLSSVVARYTSQACSRCGHIEKSNRIGELFRCKKCSFTLDADHQASLNILSVGLGHLEFPITKAA